MFRKLVYALFPKLQEIDEEFVEQREKLVQVIMKHERRAHDVREQLAETTLKAVSKG